MARATTTAILLREERVLIAKAVRRQSVDSRRRLGYAKFLAEFFGVHKNTIWKIKLDSPDIDVPYNNDGPWRDSAARQAARKWQRITAEERRRAAEANSLSAFVEEYGGRICHGCGEFVFSEDFHASKQSRVGLQSRCRHCTRSRFGGSPCTASDVIVAKGRRKRAAAIRRLRRSRGNALRDGGFTLSSTTGQSLNVSWDAYYERMSSLALARGLDIDCEDTHIDHIVPLAVGRNLEEKNSLYNIANLQPLSRHTNLDKSDFFVPAEVAWFRHALYAAALGRHDVPSELVFSGLPDGTVPTPNPSHIGIEFHEAVLSEVAAAAPALLSELVRKCP
jgi:hypothetical protein